MADVGGDGDAASRRLELIAEWGNVRSARRLYTALNEAGVDLAPVTAALVRRLLEIQPGSDALARIDGTQTHYEQFMRAAWALGEPLACDVVRALHPLPPEQYGERLPGYLFNRSKSPTDRAPRSQPNARSHAPGHDDG